MCLMALYRTRYETDKCWMGGSGDTANLPESRGDLSARMVYSASIARHFFLALFEFAAMK
jgi:hypothetical protein